MAIDQLLIVLNHPHAAVWSVPSVNTLTLTLTLTGTLVRWCVGTYVGALGRRPDADVQVVELPQHERKALIERHKRVKVRPSLSDLYDTHLYMCLLPAYTSARLVVAESLSKSTAAVL
eukprot:COSAG06_NODE_748_length_12635_cov_684.136966_4_plen_118_part_00